MTAEEAGTVWVHCARPRPAWYALPSEEKERLTREFGELDERAESTGATAIGRFSIRGQSDYSSMELWRFPAPEDVFSFWSRRVEAGYTRWFAFSNQVGVAHSAEGEER